ncbi:MAG: site-specific DNA-methyltransferase [Nitrospirae bacterium]|nr:site-specific DNA-methyltransferase [Nitrospirota bacterium]
MNTSHKILFKSSEMMSEIPSESVDLVVTSPPYPMIEMWDELFTKQNADVADALNSNNGNLAFKLMHKQLDPIWDELYRVLKSGGIACINIGDATRTLNKVFKLYSNHSRILSYCLEIGFSNLPYIIWRKQTNAPNKFMGSGMMPTGAYVTLEHEYILILRKDNKREFKTEYEKSNRRNSSFFWEERNTWFSDIWDVNGTSQNLLDKTSRNRSGAFPFEISYRLINMFSVKGDTVLDPFLGIGTTTVASMASGRNSIGYEIDERLSSSLSSILTESLIEKLNHYIHERLSRHLLFIIERTKKAGEDAFRHINKNYNFPVMTSQETNLLINYLDSLKKITDFEFEVLYFI